jgi:cytochrome c5
MKIRADILWAGAVAGASIATILAGCAHSKPNQEAAPGALATAEGGSAQPNPEAAAPATEVGGAQLWAENCAFCHNARSPTDYTDAQWDVAMMHMRMQARLPGDEARKIRDFLQASN